MNSSSLDRDYKNNCNSFCGKKAVAGKIDLNGKKVYAYNRLKCKTWGCPECGPKKAIKLQKAIEEKAKEKDLTRLLTLTLDPKTIPPGVDRIKFIRNILRKFRVYLKRKYGSNIAYISVIEYHKSGIPHLHILVNRYIPQRWISKSWEALGGGRIAHIERVADLGRVGRYVVKYMTKEAILSSPKGTRRYTTSRDIILFVKLKHSGWWLTLYSIERLYVEAGLHLLTEDFDEDGSIRFFTSRRSVERIIEG